MDLSVVIPVHNEEENIELLINEIYSSLKHLKYEIIVVDDASTDNSLEVLTRSKSKFQNLRVITHVKNFGQSAAVRTGVRNSKANWIATLDGDGQNDPSDIPNLYTHLIEKINDDMTMIAGHREVRNDTWLKRISSRYANIIRSSILKDNVPDTGCGLKIFSRERFLDLPFFDHMHRYIPALYIANGGKVVSLVVNHRPRNKGVSKYGFNNRFWVGITDLIGVIWLKRRSKKISFKEI